MRILALAAVVSACERSPASEAAPVIEWQPAQQAQALVGSPMPPAADALFRREQAVYGLLEVVFASVHDEATATRAAPVVRDLLTEMGAVGQAITTRPLAERVEAQRKHAAERRDRLERFARAQGRAGLVESARGPLMAAFEQVRAPKGAQPRVGRREQGAALLQACAASVARDGKPGEACISLYGEAGCRSAFEAAQDLRSVAAHQALAASCSGYCALFTTHPLPELCVEPAGMLSAQELRARWMDMNVEILGFELGDGDYEASRALTERTF